MTIRFQAPALVRSLTAICSLVAAAMTWGNAAELPGAETHVSVPKNASFFFTTESGPMALSRDGKRLAFIATVAGKEMIWVRELASDAAHPIAGTEGGRFPFWSPDGRFLGFFAEGKLKKISVSGGAAQTLCDAPHPRGGSWSAENTIVFAGAHDPLSRISAAGGAAVPIAPLDEKAGEYSQRFPWFLPDGRHFLYLSQWSTGFQDSRIFAGSLEPNEKATPLISANSPAVASAEGDLYFLRGRTLMRQQFDATQLRVLGEPRPVADDIQYFPNTASAMFTVADDGTIALHRGPGRMSRLVWVDRSGKEVESSRISGNTQLPRISHRADRIVYSLADPVTGEGDLWILDVVRDAASRFTSGPGDKLWAVWSPDDSQIAYSGQQHAAYDIFVKPSRGEASASVLYSNSATKFVNDWSGDGRYILFQQIEPQSKSGWDIWALDVETKSATPVIQSEFNDEGAAFSPDGEWVAYASDTTGRMELYVRAFRGPGAARQISTNGGSEPQWSDDGKRIYFRDGGDALSQVDIETAPEVRASNAVVLFPLRARWLNVGGRHWQVTGHGQRILQDVLIPPAAPAPITILRNRSFLKAR